MREYQKIEAIKDRLTNLGTTQKTIKAEDSNSTDKLREKVEKLKARQEAMKIENANARKVGESAPHPPWELSNNRQNLKTTEQRLERVKTQKSKETSKRQIEFMGESVVVIENTELMRLQLIFDDKPNDEIRTSLKKNGFRWAPKNGAWQRQLTDNAMYALMRMTE